MDLQQVERGGSDRNDLAQDRDRWLPIVSAEINFLVPYNERKLFTTRKSITFSRSTPHYVEIT